MRLHDHIEHGDSSLFLHGKNACYFIALREPSNSTTDQGNQSFEKRNANQVLTPSLNNWISGEGQRGRRKWSCIFICLRAVRVGWRQSEQQKSSQNCTTVSWSPGPQLPHLHKPHLMPAGTTRAGLWAIDEQEQTDTLCSRCPFSDSIPGGRKTFCISHFKFQYH